MAPADPRSEEALLLAVASGDLAAAAAFKTRHAALLERICGSVTPDARSRAEAHRDLTSSGDLATVFSGFDGRGKWSTFVLAAVVDRFLFPRLLERLRRDAHAHAAEFEAFFRREIARAVAGVVRGRELREDAAQWIWEQMLEHGCAQLKLFAEEARTPAFVAIKLKRLAQDFLNSRAAPSEGRRRTLPEALAAMSAFEKDVFKQFYWRLAASAGVALLALRVRHPEATEDSVRDARVRVERALGTQGGAILGGRPPGSLDDEAIANAPSVEQPNAFEEVEREAFRRAVLAAAQNLSAREKLCLLKRLQGKAAGEIARELGIPNPEAYELMRRVVDKLRKALVSHPAARERMATVTGNDSYLDQDHAGKPAGSRAGTRKGTDR